MITGCPVPYKLDLSLSRSGRNIVRSLFSRAVSYTDWVLIDGPIPVSVPFSNQMDGGLQYLRPPEGSPVISFIVLTRIYLRFNESVSSYRCPRVFSFSYRRLIPVSSSNFLPIVIFVHSLVLLYG